MRTIPARHLAGLLVLLAALLAPAPADAQLLRHGGELEPGAPPIGSVVTRWTMAADRLGGGRANWRTLAVMHMAMHDALNAVEPRYERWSPPGVGEPAAAGAAPLVAMAAAAYQVLLARHQENAANEADPLFRAALAEAAPDAGDDPGVVLGAAIGLATVARHPSSASLPRPFPEGTAPGQWRPTPPFLLNGLVGDATPFLFDNAADLRGPPPPPLGSPRYVAELEEVRRLGGEQSRERSRDQTEAAFFWAYQSSQRNFIHLATQLLAANPPAAGAHEEVRLMAQLSAGLADSFMIAWEEKRHHAWWRPVTAINQGSEGVAADPRWEPLFGTPPHPDYPSGHATDCATGAYLLMRALPALRGPIAYTATDLRNPITRQYPNLGVLAQECADSRIWAGAHFRAANEEGQRLGALIAGRALERVPPLAR